MFRLSTSLVKYSIILDDRQLKNNLFEAVFRLFEVILSPHLSSQFILESSDNFLLYFLHFFVFERSILRSVS